MGVLTALSLFAKGELHAQEGEKRPQRKPDFFTGGKLELLETMASPNDTTRIWLSTSKQAERWWHLRLEYKYNEEGEDTEERDMDYAFDTLRRERGKIILSIRSIDEGDLTIERTKQGTQVASPEVDWKVGGKRAQEVGEMARVFGVRDGTQLRSDIISAAKLFEAATLHERTKPFFGSLGAALGGLARETIQEHRMRQGVDQESLQKAIRQAIEAGFSKPGLESTRQRLEKQLIPK